VERPQFYFAPSVEAVTALRGIEEKGDVARALRTMLYNLEGPFKSPMTFSGADERLVTAFNELYEQDPESPVITKLWDFKGIFQLRDIQVSLREDASLPSGVGATCPDDILFKKSGAIRIDREGGGMISLRIDQARFCGASAGETQNRKARIWLSPRDMNRLFGNQIASFSGNETSGIGGTESPVAPKEFNAILTPLPIDLVVRENWGS
jgi:hypothetical protein